MPDLGGAGGRGLLGIGRGCLSHGKHPGTQQHSFGMESTGPILDSTALHLHPKAAPEL